MSDIINPYIAGNPVTGPEMFFGREDVFDFVQQTLVGKHRDNVIVLYGQRRTGKTSALYQMHVHFGERYLCIFTDLHGFALTDLNGFLWELASHIVRVLHRDYQIDLPRPDHDEFMADPRSLFENEFLNQVWSVIGDRHVLLMLDEAVRLQEQVQAGKLEHDIFEYLRHLMQHYERLNFLFSLGSGLEEMEQEYAFLFNVGLYKKISFLDRKASTDLITQPVKDYYQVEPAAVERMYCITSGHPYYTQLVCHCLFNCWRQQHLSHIGVLDVDDVLDEAVERGSAVLKHVWEESTPGEKAVMTGMATAMGQNNDPVDANGINETWANYDVVLPTGQMAKAIRNLIARDVITGQDKYQFTVALQRMWVQKHRRLEWVKEEIANDVREWSSDSTHSKLESYAGPPQGFPQTPPRRFSAPRIALIVGLVMLLIVGSGIIYYTTVFRPHQLYVRAQQATASANAQATASAIALHYPFSQRLVLDDSLKDNSNGNSWNENSSKKAWSCAFAGGTYDVGVTDTTIFNDCIAKTRTFTNFTYEVQMRILKGDCGGIVFRDDDAAAKLYLFRVCQDGSYALVLYKDDSHSTVLTKDSNSYIKHGLNQPNVVAVVAKGSTLDLYVNNYKIDEVIDENYSSGQIGVIAYPFDKPTEVAYNNARVWSL